MPDLLSFGEPLVAFNHLGGTQWRQGVGGDPENMAIVAARQGASVGLLMRIRDGAVGSILMGLLLDEGVDTFLANRDAGAATGLCFVTHDGDDDALEYRRKGSAASRRPPAAFLFDEPLSNLDAALRHGMRLEISELHKRLDTTMIYVTHDQVEAMTMADKIVVLQAGVIEQVGSPLELYREPRNLFVAGFIGSPTMNMLTGEEAAKRGAMTIGIRPEHISISTTEGAWKGTVGVSEHLGSDTFLHVHREAGGEPMTVRVDGEFDARHGDTVWLTPQEDQVHRFDPQGLRIA